jgi:protein involved in polysaccharide export with SLBB domain
MSPTPINPKLDWNEINPLIETIQVSDSKIAEVEASIKEALSRVQ